MNSGIGVKIKCELHPQYFLPCIGCYNDTKIENKIKYALKK